ncbi:MAG: hypothetical protein DRH30_06545 [Deltaproteobacteria bacterium]|nr:MAG: hypothetical protein DRH30_06545 [Deltaproteobacteria bacterium]
MINANDEDLHPVGDGGHWQESYYFNWADPAHDAFGLTRIGYRFGQDRIDGLVLTIHDGRPEFVYPAVNLKGGAPWTDHTAAGGLRAKELVYRMEEPLERWKIELRGRHEIDLTWTAFTPAFDYHASGARVAENVAAWHFEQSGTVTGHLRLKGNELEINGTGQRDKSWGVRDWANVEGWNWISAQFGEGLSFNVWEGFLGGERYVNGFVHREGTNRAVVRLELKYRWPKRMHVPESAFLNIVDEKGDRYQVTASSLGHCPLIKSGLWIEEVFAGFTLNDGHTEHEGIGVIEHAWHAGSRRTLLGMRQLLRAAGDLYRR